MEGHARAPAAGTVLNALATGTGSAFAIDEYVTAAGAATCPSIVSAFHTPPYLPLVVYCPRTYR